MTIQELEKSLSDYFKKLARTTGKGAEKIQAHQLDFSNVYKDHPDLNPDRVKVLAVDAGLHVVGSMDELKNLPAGQDATYLIIEHMEIEPIAEAKTWLPRELSSEEISMVSKVSNMIDYDTFKAGAFAVALLEDVNAHDEAAKVNAILTADISEAATKEMSSENMNVISTIKKALASISGLRVQNINSTASGMEADLLFKESNGKVRHYKMTIQKEYEVTPDLPKEVKEDIEEFKTIYLKPGIEFTDADQAALEKNLGREVGLGIHGNSKKQCVYLNIHTTDQKIIDKAIKLIGKDKVGEVAESVTEASEDIEKKKFKTTLEGFLNKKLGAEEYSIIDNGDHLVLALGDIVAPDVGSQESKKFESFKDDLSDFFWDLKTNKTYENIWPNWWSVKDGELKITLKKEDEDIDQISEAKTTTDLKVGDKVKLNTKHMGPNAYWRDYIGKELTISKVLPYEKEEEDGFIKIKEFEGEEPHHLLKWRDVKKIMSEVTTTSNVAQYPVPLGSKKKDLDESKKTDLIEFIKQQLNFDITPFIEEKWSKRSFITVDTDKIPVNTMNDIKRLAKQYGTFRIESNGKLGDAFIFTKKEEKVSEAVFKTTASDLEDKIRGLSNHYMMNVFDNYKSSQEAEIKDGMIAILKSNPEKYQTSHFGDTEEENKGVALSGLLAKLVGDYKKSLDVKEDAEVEMKISPLDHYFAHYVVKKGKNIDGVMAQLQLSAMSGNDEYITDLYGSTGAKLGNIADLAKKIMSYVKKNPKLNHSLKESSFYQYKIDKLFKKDLIEKK